MLRVFDAMDARVTKRVVPGSFEMVIEFDR